MTSSPPPFLENYESLDIIGNGSFGIIRKVRRKSDGLFFARKELNFERMTERDRKQIVAEVNILKDLHHDHIVRYHDRYVDRDAGILYILMEYCGGGDLSTIIKHASRSGRPIPEDTIWGYFFQILHALQHCHHPNGHGRSSSGNTVDFGQQAGGARRPQILHRDLKPDNVFLDENNTVKLGDFGLSKALPQASFANTYVGTPYYMSPELMQEKAYDSKSDIWSLGCLIYELCALKPPFHEAKTHNELSIFIRNGRIPPLPRGYSQALTSVIKSMLNLNPAMRPSAAQLLQHERLELVSKVQETEKMLAAVKNHRATVAAKERDVLARETTLAEAERHLQAVAENERRLHAALAEKDGQIAHLQHLFSQAQHAPPSACSALSASDPQVQALVKTAVAAREGELRTLVMQREAEVARAIALREEEIMEAVRKREEDVMEAVRAREVEMEEMLRAREKEVEEGVRAMEEDMRKREREVEEAVRKREQELLATEKELVQREEEVRKEELRLAETKKELEVALKKVQGGANAKGRKEKNPLEEVKNVLEPLARAAQQSNSTQTRTRRVPGPPTTSAPPTQPPSTQAPLATTSSLQAPGSHTQPTSAHIPPQSASLATPAAQRRPPTNWPPMSAMKGVVLTATGEPIATPIIGQGGLFKGPQVSHQTPMGGGAADRSSIHMALATPRPNPVELVALFEKSPRVGLNFGRIFDFEEGTTVLKTSSAGGVKEASEGQEGEEEEPLPPSPSLRTQREKTMGKSRRVEDKDRDDVSEASSASSGTSAVNAQASQQTQQLAAPPPTRIRRPSIRTSNRSTNGKSSSSSSSSSAQVVATATDAAREQHPQQQQQQQQHAVLPKPLPHPHLRPSTSNSNLRSAASTSAVPAVKTMTTVPIPFPATGPAPEYDITDEENLPSPFLKRGERADKGINLKAGSIAHPNFASASSSANANEAATASASTTSSRSSSNSTSNAANEPAPATATKAKRRASSGLLLRAVAAANNAGRRQGLAPANVEGEQGMGGAEQEGVAPGTGFSGADNAARPSLASARKASEEARKALLRP